MGKVIGVLMVLAGVVLGAYVGIWVCFIGGIVDIINEIKKPEALDAVNVAWGIAKFFFAGLFGWLSAFSLIIPGSAIVVASD